MRNTGIVKTFAEMQIRIGTGQAWFLDFRYPVLLAIALKVYFPSATVFSMVLLVVAIMIMLFIIGWVDLKYIKLPQTTANLQTKKYNPYFEQLTKDLNKRNTSKKYKKDGTVMSKRSSQSR